MTFVLASVEAMDHFSHLTKLSLANCKLTDKVLSTLAEKCKGRLHSLIDLNLTNNSSLTADCLTSVHHITTGSSIHITVKPLCTG